jgi:hypothetical protein
MSKTERTELEQRIITAEQYGGKWAGLYEIHLQLDEGKKSYLAALMNDLDDGQMSEKKLERLALGSREFRDYIKNMCIAKGEELRARVRYENARDYFEAGRSKEATERAKFQSFPHIP